MAFVPRYQIYQFIDSLSDLKIDWILLRNSQNQLPNKLRPSKDIDILVAPKHVQKLRYYLNSCAKQLAHPELQFCEIQDKNFVLENYRYYNFHLDICNRLYYCNINRTLLYPIDKVLRIDPWTSAHYTDLGSRTTRFLDQKNSFIFNILRCILWKRHISTNNLFEFNEYLKNSTLKEFKDLFYPFFADYTDQIYYDIMSLNVRDTVMNFHQHLGSTKCIPYNLR